jgi:hypothetical protein
MTSKVDAEGADCVMKRRDVLRSMALAPLAGPLSQAAEPGKPANALDVYREAFARLPTLTDDDNERLEDVATMPLDGLATDLVDRARPALDILVRGASISACDWGSTWTGEGFERAADLFGPGRRIVRLATLRARVAIEAGRFLPGINDAVAALTLGRRFGEGAVMIAQLVGMAIEHASIAAVAASLPRLDRASLTALDSRFLALAAVPDLPTTIRAERAFFLGYVAPRDPEEAAKIGPLTPWYDRLIAACNDPPALDAMRSEARSDAAKDQFFGSFDGYRGARTRADVKRSLFRAAIAVAGDGPAAIGRIPDPFDGRPFGLRTWSTGFELTSRFALDKKPNTALIVGKRP